MSSTPNKPEVAIIGAGIAGLSAAIALRRAGWQCTVYERSLLKNEIGAALCVNPSATRCLDTWGFNYDRAQPTENTIMITRKGDDMKLLGTESYGDCERIYGAKCWTMHRVDLHKGLMELATGQKGDGSPAMVKLGCAAVDLDCDEGLVRFEDGTVVKNDLVVIADGVHVSLKSRFQVIHVDCTNALQSRLVGCLTKKESNALPTGRSNYRFIIPMDKVLADPELSKLYEDGHTGLRINLHLKDEILFINYACRSNSLLSCAVVHNTRKDQEESDGWNSQSSVAQLKDTTQNFHSILKRYFDLCEEEDVKVHHMKKRAPLSSYIRGRACVIGDAAHVMLPTHGAGAVTTMESAATFEPVFTGIRAHDFDEIKKRLQIWDKLRNGRCNFVMLMSNAGNGGLNVPGVEEEIRKYYDGPLPPKEAMTWTPESRAVFFGCDPFEEGKKALKSAGIRAVSGI
jgi:salicylate hydroxylase